jgi:hypothetical protein
MKTEESKLEGQQEQLDIPVVSDSFKIRSVQLVIDAEKIEFDEVYFTVKTQDRTVEFTLSKEQAKMLKSWL